MDDYESLWILVGKVVCRPN